MFRAVLEGLAFEARAIADAMVAVARLPPFGKIITIGSSSENRLLAQIKADVYGFPIHVNPVREAVSLGAALLAGIGSGTFGNPSAAAQTARQAEILWNQIQSTRDGYRRGSTKFTGIFRGNLRRRSTGCGQPTTNSRPELCP